MHYDIHDAAAADDDDDDDANGDTGAPVEHPQLGLEAWRWHGLFGWTQTGIHSAELPGSRLLYSDGEPLHYALLQDGTLCCVACCTNYERLAVRACDLM